MNYQERLEEKFKVRVAMRQLTGHSTLPDGSYAKYFDVTISHKDARVCNEDYWYLHVGSLGHPDGALRRACKLLLDEDTL